MAVSLFVQVEDTVGSASFQCATGDQVHCRHAWSLAEQGSATTCFFLLEAGKSFSCSGVGQVNVIGAHGVNLAGKVLSPTLKHLPCEGQSSSTCSFTSLDSDSWVDMVFKATGSSDAVQCAVDSHTVCQWS